MSSREIKPKVLLKALLKAGFVVKRQRGSHVFIERGSGTGTQMTSISLHSKPLPLGTLRAILKQTGVTENELERLL